MTAPSRTPSDVHTPPPSVSPWERVAGMFRQYAQLPRLSGGWYMLLTMFARLPLAMLTIGAMSLVTAVTHSYATAGLAAGAVGIGSALGAPVVGMLADRLGQRRVLLAYAAANVAALAFLLISCLAGQDPSVPAVVVAAFASGLTCPQVGPLSRVRWIALIGRRPGSRAGMNDVAMSFEGTTDELTFVLGPALVGVLAAFLAPWLPLVLAAALTLVLVPLFALHPSATAALPAGHPDAAASPTTTPEAPGAGRLRALMVPLAVLAMVCMGTFFGGTQAALSAFAGEFADPELAGLLYSAMGLSSAVVALSIAAWPERFGHGARWVTCAALLVIGSALFLLPLDLGTVIPVLLVLGMAVGPMMVTVFAIGAQVAPAGRLSTVMTALSSGIVAGTALGYAVAGAAAQWGGSHPAFLVPGVASVLLVLLGVLAARTLRRVV
ncbi:MULTISPECIES: MFS transporter [Arthrobacter]|uniref:MFS transporter n=2 Tax=Arthrobacter TaxID=1663 RepID=A0ABU9KPC5_9MICC|nr:MFS transporter [Arthrobacter sp. YJM1]MDP5228697.1 MFS transporter [Arthrobacter sp. YJM1]